MDNFDILKRLQDCDLDKYCQSFKDGGIDSTNILNLTSEKLAELIPIEEDLLKFKEAWPMDGVDLIHTNTLEGQNQNVQVVLPSPTPPIAPVNLNHPVVTPLRELDVVNPTRSAAVPQAEVIVVTVDQYAQQSALFSYITKENLLRWIKADEDGESIYNGYLKRGKLINNHDEIIMEIIVKAMFRITRTLWTNEHYKKIAENLTYPNGIFLSEAFDSFYVPPVPARVDENGVHIKAVGSTGKVPNKVRNKKNQLARFEGTVKSRKKKQEQQERPQLPAKTQNIKASIKYLDENVPLTPEGELHWQNTSKYRYELTVKSREEGVEWIFELWKPLRNPEIAPKLIKLDFDINLIASDNAISRFENFYLIINGEQRTRTDFGIKNLEEIASSKHSSKDHRTLAQFCLLPYYFPPRGSTYKDSEVDLTEACGSKEPLPKKPKRSSAKTGKICEKFSSVDALESMIQFVKKPNEIQSLRDEVAAKDKKKPIQPYIIGVGSQADLAYSNEYFVIINDELYPADSAADAIDLCFKIFQVFHLKYPKVSEHIWKLIEQGLYQLKVKKPCKIASIAKALLALKTARV